MELYTVSTLLNTYRGRKDVRIHWKVTLRANPVGPYPDLISNYDQLNTPCKIAAEEYVDGLFTKSEAETLSWYITNSLCRQSEIILLDASPVEFEPDIYRISWEEEAEKIFLEGNAVEGLEITGYYLLEQCNPVPALIDIEAEHPLDLLPSNSGCRLNNVEAVKFFDLFGELTGVFFREEAGQLKVTLGGAHAFRGDLNDLFQALQVSLEKSP